jgi:hypothetical protein
VAAGIVYLLAVRLVVAGRRPPPRTALLLGTGLLLRTLALPSSPVLEDDFNRYLWDGAVAASGLSPYAFPPSAVLDGSVAVPRTLLVESLDSGGVLRRVNHSRLTTIYPPVAQAAFLLAHRIQPFSLPALRGVLLVFDLASALLLILLLKELALPAGLILVYWWNPLFVRETFNAAHLDVLLVPLLVAAFLLRLRGRTLGAAAFLALATGVKLWPVLLAPLLLAPGLRPTRMAAAASVLYGVLTAALLVPMAVHAAAPSAGVVAYASGWTMNGAFFPLFSALLAPLLGPAGVRIALAAAFAGLALFVARTVPSNPVALLRRASVVPAALLLLGPTAFPWYFTWLLPFLTLAPGVLLVLTAALPLYDLSFAFEYAGHAALFDRLVVPLEWLPVWAALAWVALQRVRRRAAPSLGAVEP